LSEAKRETSTSGAEVRPRKGAAREYLETILICVIFVIFSRTFVFQQSKIPTGSMKDTLLEGDYIMVNRFLYADPDSFLTALLPARAIQRGDVIVFRWPGDMDQDYIKRVIGLPGEVIQVHRHRASIDGIPMEEEAPYLLDGHVRRLPGGGPRADWPLAPEDCNEFSAHDVDPVLGSPTPLEPVRVNGAWGCRIPESAYFMMGDNRNKSADSRVWGALPTPLVKGRAWLIWLSLEGSSRDHNPEGAAAWLKSFAKKAVFFLKLARWDRMFTVIH
jgi:signal peptidase I